MATLLPKSHEQRIADLERQVAELKQIVGTPGISLGGLGGLGGSGLAQAQAAAQMGLAQAQQRPATEAAKSPIPASNQREQWFAGYEVDPRLTR